MPRSPMSVKGIRRLIDKMTNEMERAESQGLAARLLMDLSGDFELDRDSDGDVSGSLSGMVPVSGVPVDADVAGGLSTTVSQGGNGTVRVTYELSTTAWRAAERDAQ